MNARWLALSTSARSIAALLVISMRDGAIEVYGDWKVSLCRSLSIKSSERGNVCRALDSILEMGIVEVTSASVLLMVHPHSTDGPPRFRPKLSGRNHANESWHGASNSEISSADSPSPISSENSTTESESAREHVRKESDRTTPGQPIASVLRSGFEQRYLKALSVAPSENAIGKSFPSVVSWLRLSAPAQGVSESALCTTLLNAFFASEKARQARYSPGFLAHDPGEWLEPPRELKSYADYKAQRDADKQASNQARLAALAERFDVLIVAETDPVRLEKLRGEKYEKLARLERILG